MLAFFCDHGLQSTLVGVCLTFYATLHSRCTWLHGACILTARGCTLHGQRRFPMIPLRVVARRKWYKAVVGDRTPPSLRCPVDATNEKAACSVSLFCCGVARGCKSFCLCGIVAALTHELLCGGGIRLSGAVLIVVI